jgi:HK97 family phage major capsid protein
MEYKYLKELLSTGSGTEGSLLIPRKIYPTLIDESLKMLIPRECAALYVGPEQIPGSSIDLNRLVEYKQKVRLISEGAEVSLDQTEYNNLNVKPKKYGVAIRITHEMMEDSMFNLLENNLKIAGRRFAEQENTLVITALDLADNTVAGGSAMTIANVTRALQYLEDKDKVGTDFIIGFKILNDLRNIDTFVEYQKVGNTEMMQRGFTGTIYGLNVVRVSTNAGMTTGYAYVIDRNFAYVIAEKRPITVENVDLPTYDMEGAVLTQRIDVQPLRTNAICKITTA